MTRRADLEARIDAALGAAPADLVVRDVRVFDLVTGRVSAGDIAVVGDTIAAVGRGYQGRRVLEGGGLFAVPGFIDAHVHVESSCVSPAEFDRCVLPRGTTSAVWDPHEIANVLGLEGLRYALEGAEACAMDIRVALSPCVPATHLETSGARLSAADLLQLAGHPKVVGLAELMNFPGVVGKDPDMLEKLEAFAGRRVDGHAPLLSGPGLDAYLSTGVRTDHEATSAAEALEKLGKGMTLFVREGSVSKDLAALAPVISVAASPFLAFCTDDRNPLDIAHEGHLDYLVRRAVAAGADPLAVYRMASWSAANAHGLTDRGLIAPGRRADIVLVESLESCRVAQVISAGRPVEEALFAARPKVAPVGLASVKAAPLAPQDFRVPTAAGARPVIGVVPGRIITEHLSLHLPARGGEQAVDLAQDAVKVAVIERHGRSGTKGLGFVKGFGLTAGAIASSVGHDSHNITVVGVSDADMAAAANRVVALQGGFVVAKDGEVLAELALPLAGLMSLDSFESVAAGLERLREAARAIGCTLPEPFLQVSFLALPVIPHLKITDRGLVDVDRFALIEA